MICTRFFEKSVRGFTLIELMMSIGIMTLMTITLLVSYPESTTRLNLLNANNNLSLLVREAQIRGSAIDSINSAVGGYGVFIDSATSSQSLLFGDIIAGTSTEGLGIGNGIYDAFPTDEQKTINKLYDGFVYKKLCIASSTAPIDKAPYGYLCNATSTPAINTLTISFVRPFSTAHIYVNSDISTDFTSACIQIYSPLSPKVGHIRSLLVYHSGMVITQSLPCD